MIYLESFLYYIFLSSTLLFYGVGINRVAEIGFKNEVNITFYVKFILLSRPHYFPVLVSSMSFSMLFSCGLLLPPIQPYQ